MWALGQLIALRDGGTMREINGQFVIARPCAPGGLWGLRARLRAAWAVLRGDADAFTWPHGQKEFL